MVGWKNCAGGVLNYHNTGTGLQAEDQEPPVYHWDRWLGPAPEVPYNPARISANGGLPMGDDDQLGGASD